MLIVIEGPHDESVIVTGDGRDIPEAVGLSGDDFVFVADEWPQLPAGQAVTVTQVEKGIDVVIGNDIFLSRFAVDRKHNVGDFVAEEPVFEVAVEWTISGVVFIWVRRALLEIDRKQSEATPDFLFLAGTARETEELKKLPAILFAVAIVGEDGIDEIIFFRFGGWILGEGEERRNRPSAASFLLFGIEEGSGGFSSRPEMQVG